jgi:hypothetical protein
MLPEAPTSSLAPHPTHAELLTFVEAATLAPSPDNNQPWLFEERPNGEMFLYHDISRALPSDVNGMFSMIALGAALENLCIAAQEGGWEPHVRYLFNTGQNTSVRELTASVNFSPGGDADPLYPFLAQRSTCRKAYSRRRVTEETLHAIEASLGSHSGLNLHWVSDRAQIRSLASLVAAADRTRFEFPAFHQELYRQLRFTPEDAELTRDGLDVRCLELPPAGATVLHWLRKWPRMRLLNRFGLSRLLSLSSALQVWKSGTIGLLTTDDEGREGYLNAGRVLERVWLTATKLSLAFHPLGSLPILLSRLALEAGRRSSIAPQKGLPEFARRFRRIFPNARTSGLVLLFRLGEAPSTVARSIRRSARSVLEGANGPIAHRGNTELKTPEGLRRCQPAGR